MAVYDPDQPPPHSPSPTSIIRLLLVQDEKGSLPPLEERFRRAGYETSIRRVDSHRALQDAFVTEAWDIVLSQDRLAEGLTALSILEFITTRGLDLPFIVLADDVSEKAVFAAMRAGAHAFLGRHELDRLVPAVERELHEARNRRQQRRVQDSLRESEARLRALADNIPGVVFRMGWEMVGAENNSLRFHYLSEAAQMLFEQSPDALVAAPDGWRHYLLPDDSAGFEEALAYSAAYMTTLNWEGRIRLESGEQKWINLRSSPRITESGIIVWEGVMWNITHSKRVEADLRESRSQLAALSNHLQRVKEEERERIARDVHDILGGDLVALKIELSLLAGKLGTDPAQALARAHSMEKMLDTAIATVGRVTRELRPGILKDFGLAAAVESQAEDFSQRTGIRCNILCADYDLDPEYDAALALFRIFQEALTNVAKHAGASAVDVRLIQEEDEILFEIMDNGRGIAPADLAKPKSFGLKGIRERVASLGGQCEIASAGPCGTRLCLRVPLRLEHGAGEVQPQSSDESDSP